LRPEQIVEETAALLWRALTIVLRLGRRRDAQSNRRDAGNLGHGHNGGRQSER